MSSSPSVRQFPPLVSLWRRYAGRLPVVLDLAGGGRFDCGGELSPHSCISGERDSGLAALFSANNVRRADLVRVRSLAQLRPAEDLFFRNRIDALLFPGDPGIREFLAYHRFSLFAESGGQARPIAPQTPAPPGDILALHPRFAAAEAGAAADGRQIDVAGLFKAFLLEARGVIRAGAHEGDDLELYLRMGFKRILFIEANPAVYARLVRRMQNRPGVVCLLCALSDANGYEILHVTANDRHSSLLPPQPRRPLDPLIREISQTLAPTRSLDYLLREIGHDPALYNFLHVGVQGAELKVLRGAASALPRIDALWCDALYDAWYEGGSQIEDLDDFLEPFAFQRMLTATPGHPQWGDAFYLRQPAVSMRKLGQWGRLGNQVFEYAFVKIFGRRHRLRVETSPWPGNQLFGACDPLPAKQYPQHLETTYALADSQVANIAYRPVNVDLCGVFQYHSAYYAPHQAYFRELLTPVPALKGLLDDALGRARAGAKTLVALHLRRGDYGFGLFFVAPSAWYLDWLATLWPTLDAPALYIATDEPAKVLPDFAAYHPLAAADLKLPPFGADYFPDYYVLSQADHAAISNSSFSFSACMLNERGRTFMRPDLFQGRLLPFDPWNAEPLLHRELGILDQRIVAQAVPEYLRRPNDPQLAHAVRNWRAQAAESFVQIRGAQIRLVLSMYFWGCYLDLRRANLRPLPLVDAERQILARILSRLAQAAGLDAIGPYMAASLFLEPRNLPPVDLSPLPPDIQEVLRT